MDKTSPKVKEASVAKDDPSREARLAEALRTNLRRRKAQARAAAMAEVQPGCESSAVIPAQAEIHSTRSAGKFPPVRE